MGLKVRLPRSRPERWSAKKSKTKAEPRPTPPNPQTISAAPLTGHGASSASSPGQTKTMRPIAPETFSDNAQVQDVPDEALERRPADFATRAAQIELGSAYVPPEYAGFVDQGPAGLAELRAAARVGAEK